MSGTPLTDRLAGKTIYAAATDGEDLVLILTDSTHVRVRWDEKDGGPVLAGCDVRLVLPPALSTGRASLIN